MRGRGKLVYGAYRIEVCFILFPREAYDDTLAAVVGEQLVVGNALAYHTGLDNGLCGIDLLVRNLCVVTVIRVLGVCGRRTVGISALYLIGLKSRFNTAADVYSPSDIRQTLDRGLLDVSLIILDADKCRTSEKQYEDGNDEEYRLWNSFHALNLHKFSQRTAYLVRPGDNGTT